MPVFTNVQALEWDDLRFVLAVAEHRTLTAAARSLRTSHPTVARRIRAVEQRLGARLFERLPGGYAPTAAGEEVKALAIRLREEVTALERRLGGRDARPSGTVRITAPDAVADYLLADVLASLRREQPAIDLELIVSSEVVSLAQREADIAVRLTDKPDEALIGRRVSPIAMAVYAQDALAAEIDGRDSLNATWLGFDGSLACLRPARWVDDHVRPEQVKYRSNTLLGIVRAAKAGIGLAVLPCFVGAGEPALRRLGAPIPELEVELWLLAHRDLARVPRVRAVLDGLAKALAARRRDLAGET